MFAADQGTNSETAGQTATESICDDVMLDALCITSSQSWYSLIILMNLFIIFFFILVCAWRFLFYVQALPMQVTNFARRISLPVEDTKA